MSWHILKRGFLSLVPVAGLCLLIISPAYSATYYVRPDGGTATQCTGLADAKYPGAGTAQACAFSHPFYAIGVSQDKRGPLKGGDTLIIKNGSYKMGYGTGIKTGGCDSNAYTYDCYMQSIPSGPDAAQPTRILGETWNTGCSTKPELWGTERTQKVINLNGSNNIEIQCLDITDHASCGYYNGYYGFSPCIRSGTSHGPYAEQGIEASNSSNVLIKNVDIHGFTESGVYAGRLKDWTIEDSSIVGNSLAGWNGDIWGNDSNTGTITFNRVKVLYNGCAEGYPDKKIYNCIGQGQGGYGDGFGMGATAGNWVFTNCDISHNTSDGLDLLYHDGNGSVIVKRSRFEGNAGNQLKTAANNVSIENSLMIGNCDYFYNNPITWKSSTFNHCRAYGNTAAFTFRPGTKVNLSNSTLTGRGDVMVETGGSSCNGTEVMAIDNSIFMGNTKWSTGEAVTFYYATGATGNGDGPCGKIQPTTSNSIVYNTKQGCPSSGNNIICSNPEFVGPLSGDVWNVYLKSNSPARDKARILLGKSSLDYNGYDRGSTWDIGALEYGSIPGGAAQTPACADGIQYCTTRTACEGQGYYWYNNTCNAQPKPLTCADGIQYCTTQTACEGQGYYWYNNTCNAQPKPKTCADGIQYCTTQTTCEGQSHFWYNNTCNTQPKPKTCADGIQYCTTQTTCEGQSHFWYNNTCNTQPKPKTCADGIQYCTTQTACEGQNYFWYNNTCNAQPKPKTCADGIQYCTTAVGCEGQGYYWYNSTCNAQPRPEPQPQQVPQPKQDEILIEPTTSTTDVAEESGSAKGKPPDEGKPAEKKEPSQETAGSNAAETPDSDSAELASTEKTTADVSEEPGPAQRKPSDEEKPADKKEPSRETAGSNAAETPDSGSVELASTGEATTGVPEESGSAKGKPSDKEKSIGKEEPAEKGKPSDKVDSESVSGKGPAAGGGESADTGKSGKGGRGGGGKRRRRRRRRRWWWWWRWWWCRRKIKRGN